MVYLEGLIVQDDSNLHIWGSATTPRTKYENPQNWKSSFAHQLPAYTCASFVFLKVLEKVALWQLGFHLYQSGSWAGYLSEMAFLKILSWILVVIWPSERSQSLLIMAGFFFFLILILLYSWFQSGIFPLCCMFLCYLSFIILSLGAIIDDQGFQYYCYISFSVFSGSWWQCAVTCDRKSY